MSKDLTNSRLDRQNILNNEVALMEIQDKTDVSGVLWDEQLYFTKEYVANYFQVDIRTISRYIEQNTDELTFNGYSVLSGKKLKSFVSAVSAYSGKDINVPTKTTRLGVFNFKAFLNIAMLISESEKARAIRQLMLDVVIDLINQKTGGGTKYINQRDQDFFFSSIQEDNYRRQFTDALKDCVEDYRFKYAHFTDMIYVSIFKEKAKEYKKILDLKASDRVRDTFYSEILDLIASYESGFAEILREEYSKKGSVLTIEEVTDLFKKFENLAHWKPLIHRGRVKMASRDMALRDASHYHLSEYIQPLDESDFQKFLGATGDELEKLMAENQDVLKRLKGRK